MSQMQGGICTNIKDSAELNSSAHGVSSRLVQPMAVEEYKQKWRMCWTISRYHTDAIKAVVIPINISKNTVRSLRQTQSGLRPLPISGQSKCTHLSA